MRQHPLPSVETCHRLVQQQITKSSNLMIQNYEKKISMERLQL
jgi:hypothetical protein